jgi:hypothetical protein
MTCDCPKLGLFVCGFNEFVIAWRRFMRVSVLFSSQHEVLAASGNRRDHVADLS